MVLALWAKPQPNGETRGMRSGKQPDDAGDWPTRENNQTPIGEGKNSGAYKHREAAEEAVETESSSDVEATAKGKEYMAFASSNDKEVTAKGKEQMAFAYSSDAEATAKGKEHMAFASSSDKERTANKSTDNVTENKGAGQVKKKSKRREKKVRRRAKLFKESTAELVEVRTLEMVMEFKPMPDQKVVLQVPEDVGSSEFLTIMQYADDVGYLIQNERKMLLLIIQRKLEERKVKVSI